MAIKTTGAEWKAFMADDDYWLERYVEESVFDVNRERVNGDVLDLDALRDDAEIRVVYGYARDYDGDDRSLLAFFKAWRKRQSLARFAVECPKEVEAAVRAAIAAAGGKVLGVAAPAAGEERNDGK